MLAPYINLGGKMKTCLSLNLYRYLKKLPRRITQIALLRTYAGVDPDVHQVGGTGGESPVTDVADERLLPGVRPHVRLQVGLLGEGLGAEGALVGLFAAVGPQVTDELGAAVERVGADSALPRPRLARVVLAVLAEQLLCARDALLLRLHGGLGCPFSIF